MTQTAQEWNTTAPSGAGFANLLASLEHGLGSGDIQNPETPLAILSPEVISGYAHVLVWLIDGFALEYLDHTPMLRQDFVLQLESVFPSTTASAISSLLTGQTPAQHGVLGWKTYLPQPNRTLTVLPAHETDHAEQRHPLDRETLHTRIRPQPLVNRIARNCTFIAPATIAYSAYNRLMSGSARVIPFVTLEQVPGMATERARETAGEPHFTYLYWSTLDRLGHDYGPRSKEVHTHLRELDEAYARLRESLAGTDTLLLTTTDHGMRPVTERLDMRANPGAWNCLQRPLTGEPRAALAHVRPGRHRRFREAMRDHFGNRVEVIAMEQWLGGRAFGAGLPHPELQARAGDYLLLPDADSYLVDAANGDGPSYRGAHGGLTPAERDIPLFLYRGS